MGDNMYKKKRDNKAKYIIIVIITFIILAIIGLVFNGHKLTIIESTLKDSTSLISKVLYSPINLIKNVINESKEKKDIYNKYREQEKELEKVEIYKNKINELELEINKLKKLSEIDKTLSEYSYLNANVISRNVGYWYNTITINKGLKSGVSNDLAVITSDGLIGKVINVTNLTSTIKLLSSTDLNMKISVKIKTDDDYIYGLLTGYDTKTKLYTIEGVSYTGEIEKGSVVTTTGMSEIFPSGILIGEVEMIEKDNFDLAPIIKVKTNVNYDSLSFVTVLKRDL